MKRSRQTLPKALRHQAENILKSRLLLAQPALLESDTKKLIHELEVHQIELEIQNRDLVETKELTKIEYEKIIKEVVDYTENLINAIRDPLLVLDHNLRIAKANKPFYTFFDTSADEAIGKAISEQGNRQWDVQELIHKLKLILSKKTELNNYEVILQTETKAKRILLLNARQIERAIDKEKMILLAFEDITERKKIQESLELSISRSTQILDNLLEGCMILGFDWTYLYLNDSINKGSYTCEELLGRSIFEMYPGVEKTKIFYHYKCCMEQRIPQRFEDEFIFADGTSTWYSFSIQPVPEGIFVLALDITEQKNAEETLRVSEAKWRNLFDILPVGVSVVDSNRKIIEFNNALCQILDLTPEELMNGKHNYRRYLNSDYTTFNFLEYPSFRSILENKIIKDVEIGAEKEDGTMKWVSVSAAPIPHLNSSIVATIDITEQKKAKEEIVQSKAQLLQYFRHLSEAKEMERAAIAREIHDELGQCLASLKLDLIGIGEEFEDQKSLKQRIDSNIKLIDTSIKTVQKVTSLLRPQIIDELGLAPSIEWLSNDFKKRSGIKCALDIQEIEDPGGIISISLFRIFQAALTNIMLHSGASSIAVKLTVNDGLLTLLVSDNGIGITKEQIHSPQSFGIIGMIERAKHINGTFEIQSVMNQGTEIRVTVPLIGKMETL